MISKRFQYSYSDYDNLIESLIFDGIRICEIGPSGKPSIKSSEIKRRKLNYSIIDVETIHWKNYNPEVEKFEVDLQKELFEELRGRFDLIISQMTLEHIQFPKPFHKNVLAMLSEGGSAVYLYANPFSLSAVCNRILPEKLGHNILKLVGNRNLNYDQKYLAFYNWCFSNEKKVVANFGSLGYTLVELNTYLGHNYFQRVPILNQLEQLYSWVLYKFNFKKFSTLSLLHVRKK